MSNHIRRYAKNNTGVVISSGVSTTVVHAKRLCSVTTVQDKFSLMVFSHDNAVQAAWVVDDDSTTADTPCTEEYRRRKAMPEIIHSRKLISKGYAHELLWAGVSTAAWHSAQRTSRRSPHAKYDQQMNEREISSSLNALDDNSARATVIGEFGP